jgi:hypothetical protein
LPGRGSRLGRKGRTRAFAASLCAPR